jgi:hypothetical protein
MSALLICVAARLGLHSTLLFSALIDHGHSLSSANIFLEPRKHRVSPPRLTANGSPVVLTIPNCDFRSTPNNGHRQTGAAMSLSCQTRTSTPRTGVRQRVVSIPTGWTSQPSTRQRF